MPASNQQSLDQAFNMKEMSDKFWQLSECPREIWLIYALKLLEATAYFTTSFILVKFLSEEVGMSDQDAGWIYGAWGMMVSVFGMVFGFAVDNLGVRKSLLAGSIILLIARTWLFFGQTQTVVLAILLVIYPLGCALAIPVQTLALRRYTDETTQKFAFSVFYVVMNVSAALAAFLIHGVRDLSQNGLDVAGAHLTMYRVVLVVGVFCTVAALAVIVLIREIRTSRDGSNAVQQFQPRTGDAWTIIQETMHEAKFWRFFAITVIFIGVRSNFSHMDATFPKYSTREFGKDFPYELMMAINPLCIVIFVPVATYLTDKFQMSLASVLLVGSFFSGISPLFLAMSNSLGASILWLFMLSIGEAIWSPKLMEYSVAIAPEGREGTYLSLAQAPLFLSKFATGGFSGWLLETYCPETGPRDSKMMWFVIGMTTFLPSILLLFLRPVLIKDEDWVNMREDDPEDRQGLTRTEDNKAEVYGAVREDQVITNRGKSSV